MSAPLALLVDTPAPPADRTPEFTFDRLLQVNVTPAGEAVVDTHDVQATTHTHNSKGFKKDDDFAVPETPAPVWFGPTMTHNSTGLKKDDD